MSAVFWHRLYSYAGGQPLSYHWIRNIQPIHGLASLHEKYVRAHTMYCIAYMNSCSYMYYWFIALQIDLIRNPILECPAKMSWCPYGYIPIIQYSYSLFMQCELYMMFTGILCTTVCRTYTVIESQAEWNEAVTYSPVMHCRVISLQYSYVYQIHTWVCSPDPVWV